GQGACGNRFVRNIVICNDPKSALLGVNTNTKDAFVECNYNLYFPGEGQDPVIAGVPDGSYEQWRQFGFDADSVIADPCFVDNTAGAYQLRPESPAFALGFVPIDLDSIGLQRPAGLPGAARGRI
ncbi:MAG: hypothetical protein QGH33_04040, partial [Pirellulaceae bacterium]|nr:hypothetical protein [Pirellulaceae bacterium]